MNINPKIFLSKIILCVAVCMVVKNSRAQQLNITGSVKSVTGIAVPLATIENKATGKIIQSDSLGNFSVSVTPNTALGNFFNWI